MLVTEYLVVNGIVFQLPAHPWPVLVHAGSANAATCQETIWAYEAILKELMIVTTVREEIKKQILEMIDQLYLSRRASSVG